MAKSLSRKRLTLKSLKRKGDRDKDDDHCGKGLSKKLRQLQAGLSSLQTQVNTIELTPDPQDLANPIGLAGVGGQNGATGEQGATGPAGADRTNGVDGAKEATGLTGREGR